MSFLGLLILGGFMGYVITYVLRQIKDWKKPLAILSGLISSAIAGGTFSFIQYLGGRDLGDALFMYPVGLGYGALCVNLRWVTVASGNTVIKSLHIIAFAVATLLLLGLLLYPPMRGWLPH